MKICDKITPIMRKKIEQEAEDIAEAYWTDGKIDLYAILNDEGVTFSWGSYGDAFDGMLECDNGRFHVFCNLDKVTSDTSGRARFTLAHELGHYFIDEHRIGLLEGSLLAHGSEVEFNSDFLIEREADLFASRLLLPAFSLKSVRHKYADGAKFIAGVADEFGVSRTATAIRLVQEDIFPLAIILWNANGQFKRYSMSTRLSSRYKYMVSSSDDVAEGSATHSWLMNQYDSPTRGGTASSWFFNTSNGSSWSHPENSADVVLTEEVVDLGPHGFITVLTSHEW